MGLKVKLLGDLVSIKTGKLNSNAAVEGGKYPFFTCSREVFSIDEFAFDCEAILLAGNNAVGDFNVKHYSGKFNAYQRTYVITINDESEILYPYLYLHMQLALSEFKKQSVGAGTKFLKIGMINGLPISFPDLDEQKRIVALLDTVFADLEQTRAKTEQNLKNSRELFDSYLQQVFSQKGEGWIDTDIETLVETGVLDKPIDGNHGESHPKKADFVEIGVPFIMASDIKNGIVDTKNCSFLSKTQADSLRKGFAKDGDVLLSHKATIGRTAILKTDLDYVMLTPQVTYYRVLDNQTLNNEYVYWYFNNPIFLNEMNEYAGVGSTRAYIGITKQRKLKFTYPVIAKQKEIVSKLKLMSEEIVDLEPIYKAKLLAIDELKKSILQKAFSGELTTKSQ